MQNTHILIKSCLKGDPRSQKALYNTYKQDWFMVCLRYLKRREDALDVLQNALIKIFGKLDTFDSNRGAFAHWSKRIVVNECIMFQRKFWKNGALDVDINDMEITYDHSSPLEDLQLEDLTKLLQTLPDGYRLVFNMYVIEGYSHKEIAEFLDVTIGTSKSQLYKAKQLLKQKIEAIF